MIDEIIFKTTKARNRLILELMTRGGMKVGEVLKLTPRDVDDSKLTTQIPKSGKGAEVVFVPRKEADRLMRYMKDKGLSLGGEELFEKGFWAVTASSSPS